MTLKINKHYVIEEIEEKSWFVRKSIIYNYIQPRITTVKELLEKDLKDL